MALVESYITSLEIKQGTLSKYNDGFEKIFSIKNHTQLMEANKQLTNYLEQLTTELKELKAPIKTEYRIEGIDHLETKIKDILQQARVIGQKPGQCFNYSLFREN
ncbi:unnamed protein product [Rotaria sp. Silwood1]|nr:unnamed protein product [Rotaria sp. Silwood1]